MLLLLLFLESIGGSNCITGLSYVEVICRIRESKRSSAVKGSLAIVDLLYWSRSDLLWFFLRNIFSISFPCVTTLQYLFCLSVTCLTRIILWIDKLHNWTSLLSYGVIILIYLKRIVWVAFASHGEVSNFILVNNMPIAQKPVKKLQACHWGWARYDSLSKKKKNS